MASAYEELLKKFSEIVKLESIRGVLYWDMNTYMPSGGLQWRTEQFSLLSQKVHQLWTSKDVSKLIEESENEISAGIEKRNIELMRREYNNRTVLPSELVANLAEQSNKTLEVWKKFKYQNKFNEVLPDLTKLFNLNIERATILADLKGISSPYDALIDDRDPGFNIEILTKLFGDTKEFLVPFIVKCRESEVEPQSAFLSRKVSRDIQIQLVHELARFLEYPKETGRIDEVEHPLTIGCAPTDVRVTVKYHEDQVMSSFMAGMHEIGHALHSLQKNPKWISQPVNTFSYPSFGESQSRFLENIIGLSQEFWKFYYPHFQKGTNGIFNDIDLNTFFLAINEIKPSYTRIASDELTYCLHIIVRFEIERDLFSGKLDIKDLPHVWNDKYKEYLGVDVPSDTCGIMQDLHWYSHYWGYFFGYGIGDMISAQIAMKMSKDLPNWQQNLQAGHFILIREWLAKNIHMKGVMYDTLLMVKEITDKPLTTKYFKEYLIEKYTKLYQL